MSIDFFLNGLALFMAAAYVLNSLLISEMWMKRDTGYALTRAYGRWGAAWEIVKAEGVAAMIAAVLGLLYVFLNALLLLQINFIEAFWVGATLSVIHGVVRAMKWERAVPGSV